jgi:hypothetical protein
MGNVNDKIKGKANQAAGAVREKAGDVTNLSLIHISEPTRPSQGCRGQRKGRRKDRRRALVRALPPA